MNNLNKLPLGVSPKKKMSPYLLYLSEDFNYLYTKLNGFKYAIKSPNKFTYRSKGFRAKLSKYFFSNANT
jgi:hypothetical protein